MVVKLDSVVLFCWRGSVAVSTYLGLMSSLCVCACPCFRTVCCPECLHDMRGCGHVWCEFRVTHWYILSLGCGTVGCVGLVALDKLESWELRSLGDSITNPESSEASSHCSTPRRYVHIQLRYGMLRAPLG
jgi:hypothetical protein